jgi:hypothetical protein
MSGETRYALFLILVFVHGPSSLRLLMRLGIWPREIRAINEEDFYCPVFVRRNRWITHSHALRL